MIDCPSRSNESRKPCPLGEPTKTLVVFYTQFDVSRCFICAEKALSSVVWARRWWALIETTPCVYAMYKSITSRLAATLNILMVL